MNEAGVGDRPGRTLNRNATQNRGDVAPSARGGHATPVIESDAMAKKTKNAPKGKSRSQKLSVKKQPIKDLAPKQGKDVKGGAFLRIRRFD